MALRVAIVGGGISGLAAAHRLVELSRDSGKPVEIILLEASDRLGGVISTTFQDGCLLEGGPDSFLSEKPWALELCQRIGLEKELIGTDPDCRRSFVASGSRLLPVPEGFQLLAPARLWPFILSPIFSLRGKMRMACDLVLSRKKRDGADESLADFVRRRLGQECLERIAQPMIAGIYAAEPELLSLEATMPRFLQMEAKHRSLILAMRAAARQQKVAASGPRYDLFLSLKGGMETLVTALVSRLPAGSVRLKMPVVGLEKGSGVFLGEKKEPKKKTPDPFSWKIRIDGGGTFEADAVCLALPAYQSARLVERFDEPLASDLKQIPYGASATMNLVYRRSDIQHPLNGFGFVCPAIEERSLLACSFSSVKFSGRAPKGAVLLRAFIAGDLPPERESAVLKDLGELLGIAVPPQYVSVRRYAGSMAHYHVGHLDRVARIESRLAELPGLALAGNAYSGIGIPDCIHSGEMAATNLLKNLTSNNHSISKRLNHNQRSSK